MQIDRNCIKPNGELEEVPEHKTKKLNRIAVRFISPNERNRDSWFKTFKLALTSQVDRNLFVDFASEVALQMVIYLLDSEKSTEKTALQT